MPGTFQVPNSGDAPELLTYLDNIDLSIAVAGLLGTGVVSGCAVSPGAGLSVNVAAGSGRVDTNIVTVAAQTNVAVSTAHAVLPRKDLVVISDAGVASVVAGVAASKPEAPDIPASSFVAAVLLIEPGVTSIGSTRIVSKRVSIPDAPRYDGQLLNRAYIGQVRVYGHSYAAGGGASAEERRVAQHLAAMLPARLVDRSQGGAIVHWPNNATGGGGAGQTGDAGYGYVLQTETRKVRAGTTLSAGPASGATTISVTSATGFAKNQLIHIGTGNTDTTGGETRYITDIVGTTLTLDNPLSRAHLTGEPVYEIPDAYIMGNPFYIVWYGENDLGADAVSSSGWKKERFIGAMRTVFARCRSAEVFDQEHPSCVYSANWSADITAAAREVASGFSYRQATAAGAYVEIHVPDNFPGGTIPLSFVGDVAITPGSEPIWSFTVDGVAAGSLTMYQPQYVAQGHVKRLTGLTSGRHIIRATLSTLGTGVAAFDWWGIEAPEAPLILVPGLNRVPYDYAFYGTWTNAKRTSTLSGLHSIGSTIINVVSTSLWFQGQTIIFEPGTGNQEVREIQSVDSATQVTLTSPTTLAHGNGTTARVGISDPDIATVNGYLQTLIAEFDKRLVYVDIDATLNANPAYFWSDHGHFNDLGHVAFSKQLWESLMVSEGLSPTLLAQAAVQSSPLFPTEVVISAGTGISIPSMPAAEQELQNVTYLRAQALDFRRVSEVRLHTIASVAGASGARVAAAYSVDGGSSFKWLARDGTNKDGTTFARDNISVLIDTTTPQKSAWVKLPPDAIAEDVTVRIVSYNGNGTASPVLRKIAVQVR